MHFLGRLVLLFLLLRGSKEKINCSLSFLRVISSEQNIWLKKIFIACYMYVYDRRRKDWKNPARLKYKYGIKFKETLTKNSVVRICIHFVRTYICSDKQNVFSKQCNVIYVLKQL